MIDGGSLINVTVGQAAAQQPWLVQLIGYPGIAVFLTAAVTWLITRAGRTRKDLEDWRETRHEKYSQILVDIDKAREIFLEAREHIEMGGEEVPPEDFVRDKAKKSKEILEKHAVEIRLMGYPEVFGGVNKLAEYLSMLEEWIERGTMDGRKRRWEHRRANLLSRSYSSAALDTELSMRAQLGIGDPHPVRSWVRGPVKDLWKQLRHGKDEIQ